MTRFFLVAMMLVVSGCSSITEPVPEQVFSNDAELAAGTKTTELLHALPPAKKPIILSVYQFADKTGQHKPGDVAQYSKAVTQGGLAILKKALIDAGHHGWFQVLERGGLENLLQERKIIRSMRENYTTPDGRKLPALAPLKYSGVLIEGGIIAYESNVMTGGAGARYLGIGGSAEYSRDMVTVYLRAVSVSSGEVLLSVSTSKTIFSQALSGGIFKFVSFDKIVEGEAGYTLNEPPQLAVRQAIELAVYAMVMRGYEEKLWEFADPLAGQRAFQQYLARYNPPRNEPYATEAKARYAAPEKATVSEAEYIAPAPTRKQPTARAKSKKPKSIKRVSQSRDLMPGWYIQIIALRSFGNEEKKLSEKLRQSGFPIVIQKANIGSITFYRLLVGGFASKELAEEQRILIGEITPMLGKQFLNRVFAITKI